MHYDNKRDSQGATPLHNIESLMCNGSITHRGQSLCYAGGLLLKSCFQPDCRSSVARRSWFGSLLGTCPGFGLRPHWRRVQEAANQ